MNFYSVIIGTELLNGRRLDAHFTFLNKELLKRGWEHKASFIIDDEPPFIEDIFNLIKQDKNSVMFSFGGIGATPDDYTRECAANVFTKGNMEVNKGAKKAILKQFKQEAYPYRINMANLPTNAKLLKNVVTNVPGFYLEDRFFFVPGFPSMARSMVIEALDKLYPKNKQKYRKTLLAQTSEHTLMELMLKLPKDLDFSSLPWIKGDKRKVSISIASYNKDELKRYFGIFTKFLDKNKIKYKMLKE
jgi:molybdopterin-biosynthesis enzyme MoeA-like protein